MNIELRKLKVFLEMSEETTAFVADIYADGKNIGYAKNDGQGGSTYCQPHPETRAAFKAAEDYCLTLPKIKYDLGNGKVLEIPSNLENVVDNIVDIVAKEKETAKFKKKMQKDMLKGLVVGDETRYSLISWAGVTLTQMLNHPKRKELVVNKVKELTAKGEKVLNTNLPEEILAMC